jgi:SM-20-related protein
MSETEPGYRTNPEPLLVSNALLQQAQEVCRRRLANDPDNRVALASLAQLCRKQGNLSEATTLYQRLRILNPQDREVEYMHAILAGSPAPPRLRPAPFVLLKGFLPQSFHETLVPFVLSVQDKLVPAKVGGGDGVYDPNCRESLDLPGKWAVKKRFHEHVSEVLPTVTPRLNVPLFEVEQIEVKLRAYLDGHFFRLHMDCPPAVDSMANRRVSYVYFFHKMPRAYSGGDLLLFDSDTDTNQFTTASFTRIVPEDNCIVFFPSAYWHSVIPVSCPSKEYADSRFVINGHVSRRMPKPLATAAPGNGQRLIPPVSPAEAEVQTIAP